MWEGENGINKQIGEQGYEESLVPILHLKKRVKRKQTKTYGLEG